MSTTTQTLRSNNLPDVQRIITDHDSDGKAVISTHLPTKGQWQQIGPTADFFLGYTTQRFPVNLNPPTSSDGSSQVPQDITSYEKDLASPPGLSISSGTVVRFVDMAPNATSPMHRTISLDYGVVLEGEIELILDSGETRLMRRGDLCVQRGTNHAWRNVTPNDGWSRMMYVLVGAEKIEIAGNVLKEDLGDMPVVRASD